MLALVANTAPVAFGSIGIPVTTLGGLLAPMLGRDAASTTRDLSAMVGRQLPLFSLVIPAYLVVLLAGWRRMVEVLPAVLAAGLSFAVVQLAVSNLVGPELTDILSSLASLAAVAVLLRFWRPARCGAATGPAEQRPTSRGATRHAGRARLRDVRAAGRGRPARAGGRERRPAQREVGGAVARLVRRSSTAARRRSSTASRRSCRSRRPTR